MKWLRRIHLIDKFLLVFMLIFLAQSGFNLFSTHTASQEANGIDVIIRTSAAAIFGYFISANFVRRDSLQRTETEIKTTKPQNTDAGVSENTVRNQIGFTLPSEESNTIEGFAESVETEEQRDEIAQHLQIAITGAIGIISLCLLLLYRNFSEMNASGMVTVSQLRDFVSGCVGFLIGGTTSRDR